MKRLVVFLVLMGTAAPERAVLAAERNEHEIPGIVFKTDDGVVTWSNRRFERVPGLSWPTVVAEFYVRGELRTHRLSDHVKQVRETPFWARLSDEQLAFCRLYQFIMATPALEGTSLEGYSLIQILAVTQEDAQRLSKALVSVFIHLDAKWRAENIARAEEEMATFQERLSRAQTALPEALTELAAVESAYGTIKNSARYRSRGDNDAAEAAKATALRMDAHLDDTEIAIAEIRARLKIIDQYKQLEKLGIQEKLDLMEVELTIELTGLTARREAITKIVSEAKDLRQHKLRRLELTAQIDKLNESMRRNQNHIRERRETLAIVSRETPGDFHPESVTIRPVRLLYSD
ncbi:MAG: hypothetical protein IH892_03480 [Planctomycetes bacterium]|nr:hypothetical protein [Planctomycetota bacterium]